MHLQTWHRVIDLGCGSGTDTIPLAEFVGPTGKVIGVDTDNQMIATANKKAKEAGVADWVIHRHFDAMSLPHDSNYFDSCRTERLFQHVLNPEKVLSEMVRITRPGGWIVAADSDHSTLSIDNSITDIEWRMRRFRTDKFKSGYAGRQLYRLFKQQNLADITVEIFPFFSTDLPWYDILLYWMKLSARLLTPVLSLKRNCNTGTQILNRLMKRVCFLQVLQ